MLYNNGYQTVGHRHRYGPRVYLKESPNSQGFATVPALGTGAYFPVPLLSWLIEYELIQIR